MKITPILEKQILVSNESPTDISSIQKPPRINANNVYQGSNYFIGATHKWQYIGIFKNLLIVLSNQFSYFDMSKSHRPRNP